MSFHNVFSLQIQAFHAAILDDCDRASRAGQSDAMVLRLRANALALTKLQLAMLAWANPRPPEPAVADRWDGDAVGAEPGRPEIASAMVREDCSSDHRRWDGDAVEAEPARPEIASALVREDCPPDRLLAGDALSRFVSRRLEPDESTHDVWRQLQEGEPARRRRNPALPRAGFRSSSG